MTYILIYIYPYIYINRLPAGVWTGGEFVGERRVGEAWIGAGDAGEQLFPMGTIISCVRGGCYVCVFIYILWGGGWIGAGDAGEQLFPM